MLKRKGDPQALSQAVETLQKLADQNYAPLFPPSRFLCRGYWCSKDETRAAELLQRAVDQGFDKAQYNLGMTRLRKAHTAEERENAVQLIEKAAVQDCLRPRGNWPTSITLATTASPPTRIRRRSGLARGRSAAIRPPRIFSACFSKGKAVTSRKRFVAYQGRGKRQYPSSGQSRQSPHQRTHQGCRSRAGTRLAHGGGEARRGARREFAQGLPGQLQQEQVDAARQKARELSLKLAAENTVASL